MILDSYSAGEILPTMCPCTDCFCPLRLKPPSLKSQIPAGIDYLDVYQEEYRPYSFEASVTLQDC